MNPSPPVPENGYGHVYDDEGNRETVPVELHPTLLPEPELLTRERIATRALLEWLQLCEFHRGKSTAFFYIIGEDTRQPGVIAKALKISEKSFQNYRRECAVWLDGFVAALESEDAP